MTLIVYAEHTDEDPWGNCSTVRQEHARFETRDDLAAWLDAMPWSVQKAVERNDCFTAFTTIDGPKQDWVGFHTSTAIGTLGPTWIAPAPAWCVFLGDGWCPAGTFTSEQAARDFIASNPDKLALLGYTVEDHPA